MTNSNNTTQKTYLLDTASWQINIFEGMGPGLEILQFLFNHERLMAPGSTHFYCNPWSLYPPSSFPRNDVLDKKFSEIHGLAKGGSIKILLRHIEVMRWEQDKGLGLIAKIAIPDASLSSGTNLTVYIDYDPIKRKGTIYRKWLSPHFWNDLTKELQAD